MTQCEEFAGFQPFQQSLPYAAAAGACGARVRWSEGEGGQVLLVERGGLRLVSRWSAGAGTPWDQRRALRRLARWPGLTIATPETDVRGWGLVPLVTPVHHAVWRLGPDLRSGLSGKWRNQLRRAEKAGVSAQPGTAASLAVLMAEEAEQRRRRGYRSLPPAFTGALPRDALRLWDWRAAGQPAAAMAFVRHGTTASYHLGWADPAARAAGAHGVMLMAAAEALWAEGVRWLDLGPVDTERAPGLARFKLGTGAVLKRLGSTVLVLP
jgi:hypothetical protein